MKENLNKQDILFGLQEIGRKAKERNSVIDIAIYGGAALILAYDLRRMTSDIDAVNKGDNVLLGKIVEEVAEEKNWSKNWLNDGVKGFVSGKEKLVEFDYEFEGIRLYVPSPEYLLAMKCMAMRMEEIENKSDVEDIKLLIDVIGIKDTERVFEIIESFYPSKRIMPKVQFGVEQIFNEISKKRKIRR